MTTARANKWQKRALQVSPVGYDALLADIGTHAGAGQTHLYLNYARKHWTMTDENPPVGLILCAKRDHAVAKYALEGLRHKVLAAEYRTALPKERTLVEEIEKTRRQIEGHRSARRR